MIVAAVSAAAACGDDGSETSSPTTAAPTTTGGTTTTLPVVDVLTPDPNLDVCRVFPMSEVMAITGFRLEGEFPPDEGPLSSCTYAYDDSQGFAVDLGIYVFTDAPADQANSPALITAFANQLASVDKLDDYQHEEIDGEDFAAVWVTPKVEDPPNPSMHVLLVQAGEERFIVNGEGLSRDAALNLAAAVANRLSGAG